MAAVDYSSEYYCRFCGHKFKHGEEMRGKRGDPRCPRDGRPLRHTVRNKRAAP